MDWLVAFVILYVIYNEIRIWQIGKKIGKLIFHIRILSAEGDILGDALQEEVGVDLDRWSLLVNRKTGEVIVYDEKKGRMVKGEVVPSGRGEVNE